MKQAVLVDGVRTPFIKAGSSTKLRAKWFGSLPVLELMERYDALRTSIDSVVGANIGNQILPPDGSNIARIIAICCNIPQEVDARTLNINCGSGLEAVIDAAMRVEVGMAKCVLVTAVEVMSDYTAAYGREQRQKFAELNTLARAKTPMWRKGPGLALKAAGVRAMKHDPQWLIKLGLTDPMSGLGMDKIADAIAKEFQISRKELDLYALESQRRATQAQKSGRLAKEMLHASICTELHLPEHDNGIRDGQTLEQLAKLRPLNEGGVTTPGNSSQVSDGAVALIIADEEFAKAQGWPALARVGSARSAVAGCEPSMMGLGPVAAIKKLLCKFGRTPLTAFDVIETNEAFASVVLAQSRLLEKEGIGPLPMEQTNVNGGAIAIGHPVGASGARLALTAARELKERNKKFALVTLCVGGGQGVAAILENVS